MEDRHSHAMMFVSLKVLAVTDLARFHLEHMDLSYVIMDQHRNTSRFERISHCSRWLTYRPHIVWYLLECMLRQFGYVHTIPSHPHDSASSTMTRSQVSHGHIQYIAHTLRLHNLGIRIVV